MNAEEIPLEQLAAFVLGEADPETAGRIRDRMAADPSIQAAVDEIRETVHALQEDDSPAASTGMIRRAVAAFGARNRPSWSQRLAGATRVIGELVYDSRLQPAVAGFRGRAEPRQLTYRSPLGTVDLKLTPRRAGRVVAWRLHGQLSGSVGTPAHAVALVHAGTSDVVVDAEADERGYFSLAAQPGEYDVVIGLDTKTLVLEKLRVGER